MPVVAVAAIAGAAAVASSSIKSSAAKKGANAIKAAQTSSNDTQKQIYDQQRSDQEPWRIAGQNALAQMSKQYGISTTQTGAGGSTGGQGSADYGDFYKSPDYNIGLQEGNKNIIANSAAVGGLKSGAAQKSLLKYGSDYATKNYDSYFSKLATLAGFGTQANSQNAQSGQNYANQVTNTNMNAANNLASSYTANGNAQADGVAGVADAGSYYMGRKGGSNPFAKAASRPIL